MNELNLEQAAQLVRTVAHYKQEKQRISALQLQLGEIGHDLCVLGHALKTLHLSTITMTPTTVLVETLTQKDPAETLKRASFALNRVEELLTELRNAERENGERRAVLERAGLLQVQ